MIQFGALSSAAFGPGVRVRFLLGWNRKVHPEVEGEIEARYALGDGTEWRVRYLDPTTGKEGVVAVSERQMIPVSPSNVLPFRSRG